MKRYNSGTKFLNVDLFIYVNIFVLNLYSKKLYIPSSKDVTGNLTVLSLIRMHALFWSSKRRTQSHGLRNLRERRRVTWYSGNEFRIANLKAITTRCTLRGIYRRFNHFDLPSRAYKRTEANSLITRGVEEGRKRL